MPKFTFKLHKKETGLAAVGNPYRSADIKLNGKVCGLIVAPNWSSKDGLYRARMTFSDKKTPSGFKWRELNFEAESMQEAKEWINDRAISLQSLEIYCFED